MNVTVEVNNLVKRYGEIEAVKGISFTVEKGEIFGLIGPNGAGKTTTLQVLSTLRPSLHYQVNVDAMPCGAAHNLI